MPRRRGYQERARGSRIRCSRESRIRCSRESRIRRFGRNGLRCRCSACPRAHTGGAGPNDLADPPTAIGRVVAALRSCSTARTGWFWLVVRTRRGDRLRLPSRPPRLGLGWPPPRFGPARSNGPAGCHLRLTRRGDSGSVRNRLLSRPAGRTAPARGRVRSAWAVQSARPPPDCRPDGPRRAERRANPGGGRPEHRDARFVKPDPGRRRERPCDCPPRPQPDLATPRPQADLVTPRRQADPGARRPDANRARRMVGAAWGERARPLILPAPARGTGAAAAGPNELPRDRLAGFATTRKAPHLAVRGLLSRLFRRRPTLPGGDPPSTIGAGGLNFRVRDGNGCDSTAMATGNRAQAKPGRRPAGLFL